MVIRSLTYIKYIDMGKMTLDRKVVLSEYFKKRRGILSDELIEALNKAANSETLTTDEFGSYKPGTFVYKAAVVTVSYDEENKLWAVLIQSEQPILLPIIKEIRYKFIPDACVMAQLFPKRSEVSKSVALYEIPNNQVGE